MGEMEDPSSSHRGLGIIAYISLTISKKKRRPPKKIRSNSPGKRCIRTLTILSTELKTKLQRQTINAHANGPCSTIEMSQEIGQVNHFPIEVQRALGVIAHLSKWEANHKKLFISWIQKKVNQEDCIRIVAKILRHKNNYVTSSFFILGYSNNEIYI